MATSSSVAAGAIVYVVTGTNRGIGYGLVETLVARPNTLVYATARDPAKADKLQQLAKQHSNVRIVQLRTDSDADHQAAAKQVEVEAGRVDVLIANAGIANGDAYQHTEALSVDKLREHFEVNTVGPVRLFNTFLPAAQSLVQADIRSHIELRRQRRLSSQTAYLLWGDLWC